MKRILLTGCAGQIGWELQRSLLGCGQVFAVGRGQLNLADELSIRRCVSEIRPSIIVNAAAYTQVDAAESNQAEADAVNAIGPGVLAEEARRIGALLVHYSTDYIFSGTQSKPYREQDEAAPLCAYGRSKLAGEQAIHASGCAHLILRTSWVFSSRGRNFLRTILERARHRAELRIVDDQVGAPTWARFVADATALMIQRTSLDEVAHRRVREGTIVNVASRGSTSWLGFASRAIESFNRPSRTVRTELVPIASAQFSAPAVRPAFSCLDLTRLEREWGVSPPSWEDALDLCIEEMLATYKYNEN
jgi:dTDP-4-dehydrorhamnose reductase